ncbi:T-complex protein 1 subunit zeta [Trifolium repens]|nr:T-complex protein 1 subunit zeta [Trifolium repens]
MLLRVLNPNAEALNKSAAALHMNINAAKGLQDVLKINQNVGVPIQSSIIFLISIFFFSFPSFSRIFFLRLVGGAADIKFTKYGNTLERNALFCHFFLSLLNLFLYKL